MSFNNNEKIKKPRIVKKGIDIKNASANNLKGFDLHVPSGGMVVITGVSGSGKSTLVYDVIHSSGEKGKPVGCASTLSIKLLPFINDLNFQIPMVHLQHLQEFSTRYAIFSPEQPMPKF